MNKMKAEQLARALMLRHGVGHLPFEFTRTKRVIGSCAFVGIRGDKRTYVPTKIMFSAHWALAMSEADFTEVMLHEIAHALAPGHDHDYVFRAKVRALGGKATDRCYVPEANIEAKWVGICPKGHRSEMHRAPGRIKSCGKCSPRFSVANLFVWHKDGKPVEHYDVSKTYRADVIRLAAQGKM